MATSPVPKLSEAEYLERERAAKTRSEFHDGKMYAMAGGSLAHSLLSSRMGALLDGAVPAGCRVFNADMRIGVSAAGLFTYADCGMVCGEPRFLDAAQDTLLNPVLIVEVLSPSTEAYDRGKKFESYRTIGSLNEYLLVHQDRVHVEHYSRREDGAWLLREWSGKSSAIAIPRLGVTIPLAGLYSVTEGL